MAASCCGSSAADSCCGPGPAAEAVGGFSEGLYREGETDGLPEEAVLASLGCGNPLAVADLHEGERVLDLGSGGVSTCCCRRGGSARPGSRTGWT